MQVPVLVLNANFEPLNVCDLRRALGLVMSQRATVIVNGRGNIHTVREDFPIPSVIRLQRMVNCPRFAVKFTRRELFRRDHYTCQYCGKQTNALTIDHVIPRHMGGKHVWTNVVAACPGCNHRKGGRTLESAGMRLISNPSEPPASKLYRFGTYLDQNSAWEMFLTGW